MIHINVNVMWCSSTGKLSQLPSCLFSVAGALVCPVNSVRDLGAFIDNDLGAATHVRRTVSCCFVALRQLRRYVTDDCLRSLVVSLVHTRLDYGNFVLVGLPLYIYSGAFSLFSTLAASTTTSRLQGGRHDISCAAWSRATIPE